MKCKDCPNPVHTNLATGKPYTKCLRCRQRDEQTRKTKQATKAKGSRWEGYNSEERS